MKPVYLSIQTEATGNRIRRLLQEKGLTVGMSRRHTALNIRRQFTNGCPAVRCQALTTW